MTKESGAWEYRERRQIEKEGVLSEERPGLGKNGFVEMERGL